MFYNPVYLKKSGRFGLIWLAATQTKILSRRELATINISRICSDIFTHVPGLQQDKSSRSSRFSLYLCCQLMYGSVKVIQKQWDFLLVDAQALCKRCTDTPSTTKEIDMAAAANRQAPCIESNVPRDAKEANLDPYFGDFKEAEIDVEAMLEYLESLSESRILRLESLPMPVKPEIGSPHSVSDPRDIQIRDDAIPEMAQISVQPNAESDLPRMDIVSFLSISHDESFQEIQERLGVVVEEVQMGEGHLFLQEQMTNQIPTEVGHLLETEDKNVSVMRDILMDCLPQTDIAASNRGPLSALEETPMAKPTSDMPGAPHKPKPDRPKRQKDPKRKESRFQDICNGEDLQQDKNASAAPVTDQLTSSDDSFLLRQQQRENVMEQRAGEKGHGHDWAQKNAPIIDLPPIAVADSPLRRKKPHKLIIDQLLMISRPELKQQMKNTNDIVLTLKLPDATRDKNIYREPTLSYLKQKAFNNLYTRNCKLGLRMEDTGSESDSLPSPRLADFLSRKRARGVEDAAETPANKMPRRSTIEVASVEKARDRTAGSLSESLDRNLSHSLVEEPSIHRPMSSSARDSRSLPLDYDTSKDGSILERDAGSGTGRALTTLPEEPELRHISPIRHAPQTAVESVLHTSLIEEPGITVPERSPQQEPAIPSNNNGQMGSLLTDSADTPRTIVFKLVEKNIRSSNDWTTFQAICPPTVYNKKEAACMFHALCAQVAQRRLCVRQDEPYGSIFVWVLENVSGTSDPSELEITVSCS